MSRTVIKSSMLLCGLFALLALLANCSRQHVPQNPSQMIQINTGWQYRMGDSPVDAEGRLIWLDDSLGSAEWTSVDKLGDIPDSGYRSLWIRTCLPDTTILTPALHLNSVRQIIQIYLNGQRIYQFGDFTSNRGDHFMGWHQLLVRLPCDYSNSMLYFRIWSGGSSSTARPRKYL